MGSVPFSATYFCISLRSYTWPDFEETTGSWGGSPEIAQKNMVAVSKTRRASRLKTFDYCSLYTTCLPGYNYYYVPSRKATAASSRHCRLPKPLYPGWFD
jgi:hypothetical protein